jgi:hypothetical protein
MIYKSFLLVLLFILSGCSLKSPSNQWEYDSTNSFDSYTKNFLSSNDLLAASDLKKAIKSAKQSADLNQLGRIYLGVCGLQKSVGQNTNCQEYQKIQEFITSKELQSYYKMLRNTLSKEDIAALPSQYKNFSQYFLEKNFLKAFKAIQKMKQSTSQFIAAALIKEHLSKPQIKYLIEKASFYGYKKLVIYWLKNLSFKENDTPKKELIKKKIQILQN